MSKKFDNYKSSDLTSSSSSSEENENIKILQQSTRTGKSSAVNKQSPMVGVLTYT